MAQRYRFSAGSNDTNEGGRETNGDRLDITLLGATGFTGRYIAAELCRSVKKYGLRLGLAGRDISKLQKTFTAQQLTTAGSVRLLQADINSTVSLDQLCQRTRLLINACGPYHQLGKPVIRACLRAGTHYLDICGEQLFIEQCEAALNDEAERQRVYCISTCGFDSIPVETAGLILEREASGDNGEGRLNGFRCYMQTVHGPSKYDGVHFGTWLSSMHGTASEVPLAVHRWKHAHSNTLPKSPCRLASKPLVHRAQVLDNAWCVPFPGPDVSVHARTQKILRRLDGRPAVQMQQFIAVRSWTRAIVVILAAIIFGILCYIPGGQILLRKFPELFSAGLINRRGPTEQQVKTSRLRVVCEGEAWHKTPPSSASKPDMLLRVDMNFPEAAYATTALCVTQCAFCVLQETEKLPGRGGVMPPGAAFANTSLVERLRQNGVTISTKKQIVKQR